jgi:3-deoxy-D-manno-octulosonic acid kinase
MTIHAATLTESQVRTQSELIRHDAAFPVTSDWFQPSFWAAAEHLGEGRGGSFKVSQAGLGKFALRHYLRGGKAALLSRDAYLHRSFDSSRASREFTLLRALHLAGVPVPRPLAARVVKTGLVYRQDLLTHWLDGGESLLSMGKRGALSGHILRVAGHALAQLYQANVLHADLNAANLLWQPNHERVMILDFDQAKELRRPLSASQIELQLARLARSFKRAGLPGREWVGQIQSGLLERGTNPT